MKKLLQFLPINLSICFLLMIADVSAQFQPSTIFSDISLGPSINTRNTGNDVLFDGTNIWEVSVWEDNLGAASGYGFSLNNATYVISTFSNQPALDPDVVFITDNSGRVHFLVTYYDDSAKEYVLDDFRWNGTTFILLSSTQISNLSSFGTGVNIDADEDANFIVIFDHYSTFDLYAVAGNAFSTLTINTPYLLGSSAPGTWPDVCLYGGSTDRVTYTYLSTDQGTLYVESDDWTNIATGGTNNSTLQLTHGTTSCATSGDFGYPRIACPNSSTGNIDYWTVVFMDYNVSNPEYFINGFTWNGSSQPIKTYNDGNNNSLPFKGVINYRPVVSYDDNGGVYVGWNLDNTAITQGTISAFFPILFRCDIAGDPVIAFDYWEVPNPVNTNDSYEVLSLAGRYGAGDFLLTFSDVNGADIYNKYVPTIAGQGSLKQSEHINEHLLSSITNDFDNSRNLTVRLFDLSGKMIYSSTGNMNAENSKMAEFLMSLKSSVYILEVITEGELPIREKNTYI